MKNFKYFLRSAAALLILTLACSHEARCQMLTSPGRHVGVYPAEAVQVTVSEALNGHDYIIINSDNSEMAMMSVSGSSAHASIHLPDGTYHVADQDGSWNSPSFTVETHMPFRYVYPELSGRYALPSSGGTVTIELTERLDPVSSEVEAVTSDDSWYQLYESLAQWNAGAARHNALWNDAFSWDVCCDEDDLCVRITVTAPANHAGGTLTAELGLLDGLGRPVTITQEPDSQAGGEGAGEDSTEEDDGYNPYLPAFPSERNWTAVRHLSRGLSEDAAGYAVDVAYFNGIGLPSQEVKAGSWDAARPATDIITFHRYDALLREGVSYLPYASWQAGSGSYDTDASGSQAMFYEDPYYESCPFSRTVTEFAQGGRTLGATIPGEEYQEHGSSVEYLVNEGFEMSWANVYAGFGGDPSMRIPWLEMTPGGGLRSRGFMTAGSLTGVRTTDGDGRVSVAWKDVLGNDVAMDRFISDTLCRVLYVRDIKDRLACVLTPEGYREFMEAFEDYCAANVEDWDGSEDIDWLAGFVISGDSSLMKGRCYVYTYDGLGRVVSKRLPGRDEETFGYDGLDRVVASQDGNQRSRGVTMFYSYDGVGNLISKSARKDGADRTLCSYSYSPQTGLKTSETVYRLTEDGWVDDTDSLVRTFSYDARERLVSCVESASDGSYSLTESFTYDLADNVVAATEQVGRGEQTVVVTTSRTYDDRGRVTGERVSLDGQEKSSVSISYDELGRPESKTYGSGADAITEYMIYTVQGWTAGLYSDLLRQYLHYEDTEYPSWTGNITGWDWTHQRTTAEAVAPGAAAYQPHAELFTYDELGRLSGSEMNVGTGTSAASDLRWSERNIRYDLDGNILHLDRYQGSTSAPETALDFAYDGPRRDGYSYDANGNITYDPLRNFEIRYNLLNLASEVCARELFVIGPGIEEPAPGIGLLSREPVLDRASRPLSKTVFYADGTRAGVMTPDADAWISRYIGSLIYCGEGTADSLVGVVTADGFIDCEDAEQAPRMRYYLRDHLGSVRVIAQDRNTVIARSDYLPFGVRMTGEGLPESDERSSWLGFSGKENEMWDGVDLIFADGTRHWTKGERYQHFGVRAYDPVTCVFMQIDPLAEKYYAFTPYGYCAGNPVRFQDPDGADGKDKIVGIIVGVVTNIIPGSSGLRDGYTPENPSDYNDGLRSADIACLVVGGSMTVGGAAAIAAGEAGAAAGVVAVASVAGAPEGVAVAAAGATTAAVGELAIGAGAYVMAQSMDNSARGYDRGKKPSDAKKAAKKQQSPREIARIDAPHNNTPGSQWHAHSKKNNGALNQDMTIKDRDPKFSKKTIEWLKGFGWGENK